MGLDANVALKLIDTRITPPNTVDIEHDINALIEQARVRRPDLVASEAQVNARKPVSRLAAPQ